MTAGGEEIAPVVRTITQDQLNAYAEASGDRNPLHLDPEFARATQFGGIIAHGMLTMAFLSEMMVARFGRSWLETGSINVRFRGAAYVGDEVETWGRVTGVEEQGTQCRVTCSLGVRNRATKQEILGGSATVLVPTTKG